MTQEEIVSEIGKPILRPIGFAQLVCVLALFVSPFIWIWGNWSYAWKTGLTGLIGTLLFYWIYRLVYKIVTDYVVNDKEISSKKFKDSLDELKQKGE
jgi:hypothetical protein